VLIGVVKDVEVIVINVVADQDIGDELHDCGLANTSLPNEKDGVWRLNAISRYLNDPLLERFYVARKYGQDEYIKDIVELLDGRGVTLVVVFECVFI